jgi:hypothetical protein
MLQSWHLERNLPNYELLEHFWLNASFHQMAFENNKIVRCIELLLIKSTK